MDISKDYNHQVGSRIRSVRESMHLTREQFSELCSISDSFLAAVESGKKSITAKTLYKICTGTKISADFIVLGNKDEYDDAMIIEIIKHLDSSSRESAIRILSEFSNAIRQIETKSN